MSLAIDIDTIGSVLLADGWHDVSSNTDGVSSFDIDSYEYLLKWANYGENKSQLLYDGGAGFRFMDSGRNCYFGSINSILAVKTKQDYIDKKIEVMNIELNKPNEKNK